MVLYIVQTSNQRKLLVLGIEGVLFGVCRIIVQKPYYQLPHFLHGCYIYYARSFSSHIINVAKDYFKISFWLYILDCKLMEHFMYEFE